MFSSQFRCPDCGCTEGFRSRRKTLIEKHILPLLFLQPVRCAKCFRRSNASSFATVRERERKEKSDLTSREAA